METIFFFFRDKQRFKFFLKCVLIAIPIFAVIIIGLNYYEGYQGLQGTPNSDGGINYYYKGNGTDKIPEVISSVIDTYPNSTTTSINVNKDSINVLKGNIIFFTTDDFEKVKDFYKKQNIEIINENESNLEFKTKNEKIMLTKENKYDDDPIQDQNKYNIYFH